MSAAFHRETIDEYLARGGKIAECPSSDVAPRRPLEEPQVRALSLHPEKRKILRKPQRRKYTAEQEAQALELLRAGKTQRAVCQELRLSQWTVSQVALAHGLGKRSLAEES